MGFSFQSRGLVTARVRMKRPELIRRYANNVTSPKALLEFKILDLLEFTSDRKRMSVVVQYPNDNVIYPLLDKKKSDLDMLKETMRQLEAFGDDGIRTLTIAQPCVDEKEYLNWSARFKEANSSLEEIDKRKHGHTNKIDKLMTEIERDLKLLGATAIEDKLKQNAPSCIAYLMRAGMRKDGLWHLSVNEVKHNHPAALDIAGHAVARLLTEEQKQVVRTGIKAGSAPRDVLTGLRLNDKDVLAHSRTIYNERAKLRKEELGGREPIRALIDELREQKYRFKVGIKPGPISKTNTVTYRKRVAYIDKQWIPFKTRFVSAWTNLVLHFNNVNTSRVEGAHSVIKKYLKVSTLYLWDVCRRLKMAIRNAVGELRAAIGSNDFKVWSDHEDGFYSGIVKLVSAYALHEVHRQMELLDDLPLASQCAGVFTTTVGLPCVHTIAARKRSGGILHLGDFHKQ
ncbi:hypothetical protein PsorP6_012054 [Peronosclerospora sorghi]|uniref:Uncharacterized protein n=1 Tax=Peronosclerospora sorghi TaxID=230839 RepID=A0ACC0WJ87_9STRA|nr:hypothetical protein PsorP6_012054 [Peronosclerospora sorghi]